MSELDTTSFRALTRDYKIKFFRHVIQAQIFILLVYSLTNPFKPINLLWKMEPTFSLSIAISGKTIPIDYLIPLAIIILVTVLFGRSFCGWICPLGFIQDFTAFTSRKRWIPEAARLFKYTLLLGGYVMLLISGWTFLEWITPSSMLSRALGSIWVYSEGSLIGIIILSTTLIFTAFTEKRSWCRYVCPLGATLSVIALKKFVKINLNKERCIKCKKCEQQCSMGIINVENEMGIKWDSECILCFNCKDTCPAQAIELHARTSIKR